MKNTVDTVVNYINKNTSIKDKRIYMSLLYLNRYILKDTIIRDFGMASVLLENSWFTMLNERAIFPMKNAKNINDFLEYKYEVIEDKFGKEHLEKTKEHFENIGVYKALNDTEIDKFIALLDGLSITLDDVFEIYSKINMPDRDKNDFFTPMNLSDLTTKISSRCHTVFDRQETVSIADIACGVGNLLYSAYKDIKSLNPDIEIVVFGNDLDTCYSSFALSIFQLFTRNSFIENKDALLEDIFEGAKFDIVVGNPPFGAMKKSTYETIKKMVA